MTARDIGAQLDEALEKGAQQTRCQSMVIARRDGLVIAHRLSPSQDPRVAASLAATIFGAAEVAVTEFKHAGLSQVVISCASARIVAQGAGSNAIVIALYDEGVNLGLVLLGLSQMAQEVEAILHYV